MSSAVHAFVLGKVLKQTMDDSLDHAKNVGIEQIGFSLRSTSGNLSARLALQCFLSSSLHASYMKRISSRVELLQDMKLGRKKIHFSEVYVLKMA